MKEVSNFPIAGNAQQGVKTRKVLLKNVVFGTDGQEDIEVEVVPFNRRNDDHVDFAFAFSDMLQRVPSEFSSISDAARRYVQLFMVHSAADETNADSKYNKVCGDLRSARILLNQPETQLELTDFFGNA